MLVRQYTILRAPERSAATSPQASSGAHASAWLRMASWICPGISSVYLQSSHATRVRFPHETDTGAQHRRWWNPRDHPCPNTRGAGSHLSPAHP